jgi:hypothetical protein
VVRWISEAVVLRSTIETETMRRTVAQMPTTAGLSATSKIGLKRTAMATAMSARRAAPAALAGIALAWACASPALAFTNQATLGAYIFGSEGQDERRGPAPAVARYVSDEGESFVLDRSTPTPLLRFEESREVIVLNPQPAARGDIIYRDDVGAPVLRATKLGGLTLFARGRPGGAPVAFAGQAPGIRLQSLSPGALGQRMLQAAYRASRASRQLISFEAPEVTPGSEGVYADAAWVAADAMVRIAQRKDARALFARFNRIVFTPGKKVEASLKKGALRVSIIPAQGLAGRPSSARISEVITKGR